MMLLRGVLPPWQMEADVQMDRRSIDQGMMDHAVCYREGSSSLKGNGKHRMEEQSAGLNGMIHSVHYTHHRCIEPTQVLVTVITDQLCDFCVPHPHLVPALRVVMLYVGACHLADKDLGM